MPLQKTTTIYSDSVAVQDSTGAIRITPATLTIEDGFIQDIDTNAPKSIVTKETLDLSGTLVTPAFVNAHTHLAMAAFRGLGGEKILRKNVIEDLYFKVESLLTREDIRAFARIGAYESLFSGVAVVWDHYYHGKGVADALVDTGLNGVVAPTLQDLGGPAKELFDQTLSDTIDIAHNASYSDQGVFASLGPHATDTVSNELWARVLSTSQSEGLPIHAHLAQSLEEYKRNQEKHGLSPVERMKSLGILDDAKCVFAHGIYASKKDLELLNPKKHLLALCPYSQLQFCFPASAQEWLKAGVTFGLATDCGASNDSMNPQGELRWLAGARSTNITSSDVYKEFLDHGGLDRVEAVQKQRNQQFQESEDFAKPEFLLSTLWSKPGAWTPKRPAGTITKGAWAHLAVWDLAHPALWPSASPLRGLAFGDAQQALTGLMVRGQWIGERGRFKESIHESTDYKEAIKEATSRFKRLATNF